MSTDAPPLGLRERKKQQTRRALLEAAERLFRSRGYDNVTVAEIAAAANISVKTLFTYFRSKEDLAFADERVLIEQILQAVAGRPAGTSPADAVGALLIELIAQRGEGIQGLQGHHRMVGDSPTLQLRLLRMWSEYEDDLTTLLASDFGGPLAAAKARLEAMQLVALVRSVAAPEVLALAERERTDARRRAALQRWVASAVQMVDHAVPD